MSGPKLQVCFSPALLHSVLPEPGLNIVVIDILRATTAMCTAFGYGVASILPVEDGAEALQKKKEGWAVAGEKDGIRLPFADFGNSPTDFRNGSVQGLHLAYSTTNGTKAILRGSRLGRVFIASFVNMETICGFLARDENPVLLLCAGWKDSFSLEDAIFAGAMSDALIHMFQFHHDCDSVTAAMKLWTGASNRLMSKVSLSSHYLRLLGIETRKGLKYCFFPEKFPVVPSLVDGKLVDLNRIGPAAGGQRPFKG